jgi:LysM repeat protein
MKWVASLMIVLFLFSSVACGGGEKATSTSSPISILVPTETVVSIATPTTARETKVYIVKPGDTLGTIADQFGTTVEAIVKANDIKDPDFIKEGQELIIPGQ